MRMISYVIELNVKPPELIYRYNIPCNKSELIESLGDRPRHVLTTVVLVNHMDRMLLKIFHTYGISHRFSFRLRRQDRLRVCIYNSYDLQHFM